MPAVIKSRTAVIGGNDGLPVPNGKCIRDCSETEFRGHCKKLLGDKYDATLGLESLKQVFADALNAVGQKGFDRAVEVWFYENESGS
jgi:hypothetical protein